MTKRGIWEYADKLKPFVKEKHQLSLSEGNTPLFQDKNLCAYLNLEKLFLKREDFNPTGSHKDRGLAFQISAHIQDKKKDFVISSSGNSAISAINLLKNTNHTLYIYLSTKLSVEKIARLVKILPSISPEIFKGKETNFENFRFHFTERPLSTAFSFAKENNFTLLRGSTDQYGFEGFKTISYEIEQQDTDFDSIFIPTSSGTTAKGIFEGFKIKRPFHIIQTAKINTLVHRLDKDYIPSVHSIADSIVDRIGHRVKEIEQIMKISNGTGWIISDGEIQNAQDILQKFGIKTSNESALTIAAILKAKSKGWNIQKPLCIFTGIK